MDLVFLLVQMETILIVEFVISATLLAKSVLIRLQIIVLVAMMDIY